MDLNNQLRNDVKLLKAFQGITYRDFAEYLDINQGSLYLWLRGNFNLSYEKCMLLKNIIEDLKEV